MANPKVKTEHVGPKNGGGGWGHRDAMKQASKKRRRAANKKAVLDTNFWILEPEHAELQRAKRKRGR